MMKLTINISIKNIIIIVISFKLINPSLFFNIFSTDRYIELLASNGASMPNIFLLTATKMMETIQ